jgi:5-methylcytosine-specific restriction endonuclease McrA
VELSIARETHDKLRRIQALLGHTLPSGKVEDVLDRALDLALAELEKQKFAKVDRPRAVRPVKSVRTIPAHVRRAVYERDAGRCAWVGPDGHRCGSTKRLELDHIVPVARGGASTVANLRLLCRIHNQYAAEAWFGREFMIEKRGGATSSGREPSGAGRP